MHDDLTQFCADRFEKHVAELFEQEEKLAVLHKYQLGHAPIIGFPFHARDNERQYIKHLQRLACAALAAIKWHERHASAWAQPLPVSCDELDPRPDTCSAHKLLLYHFGRSVRHHEWNLRHPPFPDWACTVMASEFTSEMILRSNLDEEFPPQKIVDLWGPGTTDPLHWCSPEKAARDKAFWEFHRLRDEGVSFDEARKISGWHRGA